MRPSSSWSAPTRLVVSKPSSSHRCGRPCKTCFSRRTRYLINAETLALVKPGVHLVNIARGALVDQDALRVALDDGRVAMATLDTVDPEPLPEGHWLYSHPKVRLSAHVSWASPAGMDRTLEIFVDNLRRYAAGEQVLHVVDADEGY